MKRFCTYFLLLALTLQSFYRCFMTMDYEIHLPEYIAQCINKNRPELQCNGQCVLMKKISEQEKNESKKNLIVYEYSSLYLHKTQLIFDLIQPSEEVVVTHTSFFQTNYLFNHFSTVFRPPIA